MNQTGPAPEACAHCSDHLRNIQGIGIRHDKRTLQSLPRRADRQQSANQIVERQQRTLRSKRTQRQRKGCSGQPDQARHVASNPWPNDRRQAQSNPVEVESRQFLFRSEFGLPIRVDWLGLEILGQDAMRRCSGLSAK